MKTPLFIAVESNVVEDTYAMPIASVISYLQSWAKTLENCAEYNDEESNVLDSIVFNMKDGSETIHFHK